MRRCVGGVGGGDGAEQRAFLDHTGANKAKRCKRLCFARNAGHMAKTVRGALEGEEKIVQKLAYARSPFLLTFEIEYQQSILQQRHG